MQRLYSYAVPADSGAAPNPYWGVCTLALGQPQIRLNAQVGDWIAGTGPRRARTTDGGVRDLGSCLIYAMRVSHKLTTREYDQHTREHLTGKIPDWSSADPQNRVGDSIYDYTDAGVALRPGVHPAIDPDRDRAGKYVLLSDHFFYFGIEAVELPLPLREIANNERGHRVSLNDALVAPFVAWLDNLGYRPCTVIGEPLLRLALD